MSEASGKNSDKANVLNKTEEVNKKREEDEKMLRQTIVELGKSSNFKK